MQIERRLLLARCLLRRECPGQHHPVQHPSAPCLQSSRSTIGVVRGGPARKRRQHRRLTHRDEPRRAGEVELRGRLDSEGAVPERNPVQVLRKDLLLGQVRLEPHRPQCLLDLPGQRSFPGHQHPRELLRDRGSSGHDPTGADVAPRCPGDRHRVHARVGEEALVLGRDERVTEVRRDLLACDRNRSSVLPRSQLAQQPSAAIENPHRRDRTGIEHPLRKWTADPESRSRDRHAERAADRPRNAAEPCSARGPHRLDTCGGIRTSNDPPSERPDTSGSYISSPCAGLSRKVPGVVARATNEATCTPGGR